jgi:hypothetical protein
MTQEALSSILGTTLKKKKKNFFFFVVPGMGPMGFCVLGRALPLSYTCDS